MKGSDDEIEEDDEIKESVYADGKKIGKQKKADDKN